MHELGGLSERNPGESEEDDVPKSNSQQQFGGGVFGFTPVYRKETTVARITRTVRKDGRDCFKGGGARKRG
jgi:hypothetical protein